MNTRDSWLAKIGSFLEVKRHRPKFRPEIEFFEKRLQPTIAPAGTAFMALTGQTFSGTRGSFAFESGTSSSNYTATILWGDGHPSSGSIDGSGNVSGSHTYSVGGTYAVAFQVINPSNQHTGVGIARGLVENLTAVDAFEDVGSYSVSQTPAVMQSGSDTAGSFSLA